MDIIVNNQTYNLAEMKVRKEKENYIVENLTTGDFYEMNVVSIHAIHYLKEKREIGEIVDLLQGKYPDEDIEMDDFLAQLLELGLLESPNQALDINVHKKSLLNKIPITFGKIFFNRITISLFFLLIAIDALSLILIDSLHPAYSDFFIFEPLTFNLLTWLVLSFMIVMFHESGHILAARAFGLDTGIEVGSRLLFVVFETDLTYIWRLPKQKRNIIYFAGLFFDHLVLFFAIIGQFLFQENSFIFLFCKLVLIQVLINIIYQFAVFMKTDLYYVLENSTGCYNLQEMAKDLFLKTLKRKKQVHIEKEKWKFICLYGLFYFVGSLSVIIVFLFLSLPQMVYGFMLSWHKLYYPINTLHFWDGFVFIVQTIFMLALLLFTWYKKLKAYKHGGSFG